MPIQLRERPEGFAAYARQFGRRASRQHFHIAHSTYDRWCAEVGITGRLRQSHMPMPNGFANHAAVSTNEELMERYGVGKTAIIRWRKEAGVPGKRNGDTKKPVPEDFANIAKHLTMDQLCKRYNACETVVRRWKREANVESKRVKPFSGYVLNPPAKVQDNRPDSLVTRAQSHLQRIGPVWKRGDGFYVFGHQMSVDEMLARAEATGWDQNEWKRVNIANRNDDVSGQALGG